MRTSVSYGTIGRDCVIKNTAIIKDAKIGECAYIKGAFKLKNVTIFSDEDAVSQIGEGVEMVMPGDNVEIEVKLITPVACDAGLRFAIREGGRTVGSGVVTAINE